MEPQYPIRTASRLTSVSLDTLRAWERRYQAVTPERTARGRLYSKENIARLILLRKVVEQGHSIGQIATLSSPDLQALLSPAAGAASRPEALESQVTQLADWFAAFDDLRANKELSRLAVLTPPRDLVMYTLLPLMRETGRRWEEGEMGVAQEHLVSASMHYMLGSLLRIHPPAGAAPRMIFATMEGDFHDFGILAGAMISATVGWSPLFLGASLPASDIVAAVEKTKPPVVVIGNSGHRTQNREIGELAALMPPDVALWFGGTLPDDSKSTLPASVVLIANMEDFENLCTEALR